VCLHTVGILKSCHVEIALKTGGKFWDIKESRGNVCFDDLLNNIAIEITNLAIS